MNGEIFRPVGGEVKFVVPDWYSHDTYLAAFSKKSKELNLDMHPEVNGENYPHASTRLTPGARFSVQPIGIHDRTAVRVSECVRFLIAEGASLTGPHGLLCAFEMVRQIFLPGYAYVSHDVKEMAHRDAKNQTLHPSISVAPGNNHKPCLNHPISRVHGGHTRLLLMKHLSG